MKRIWNILGLAVLLSPPALRAEAPRPNVIFILTDDLGWGDLGVFHQNSRSSPQKFATPKLDAFANEGMQLRRHYAPAPVCAPSRASLILGVHQGHANLRNNQFDQALDDNHTLGTVFKAAGYDTACIGKWGLQGPGTPANQPSHPSKRGFDYFFGYLSHLSAHFHYPQQMSGNDNQGQPNGFFENTTNLTSQLAGCYSTDLVTARAKKWIADQRSASPGKPFFLYMTYAAPHARLDVPTQAYPEGGGIDGGVQWNGEPGNMINTAAGTINSWIHPDYAEQAGWSDPAKRYATMVRRIDDAIGDLVETLQELSIDGNTLIVFTSDNGPANEAGSGGNYTYDPRFFGSFGPLEGIKRDVLEGGIRVPALVRWPGQVPAGGVSQSPSQFHDWLPTFAELAGVPKPERADGVSLVPTLTGQGMQKPSTVYVEYAVSGNTPNWTNYFTNHANRPRNEMQVVYVNGYKGIRTGIGSHADTFRIYDTAADPAESTNLAGMAGVPPVQEFKDRVLRLRRASGSAARGYLDGEAVPAAASGARVNGLRWKAYEKESPWVPDWEDEEAVSEGEAGLPDPAVRTRDADIGLLFEGYLRAPAEGNYTFYLQTDTGAFVRLHDLQLIDADWGYAGGTEKSSGSIRLKAGDHPIRIHYRHGAAGGHQLALSWEGPGIDKQPIPASAYVRDGETAGMAPTAVPDAVRTTGSVLVNVLGNDSDDGWPEALQIVSVSAPRYGTAAIEGNAVRYTPKSGFLGDDVFTYRISDGEQEAEAEVSVEVIPVTTVLWMPFDETSGSVAADVLGRPLGMLTSFSGNPWAEGKLGQGLTFDGTDDRVVLSGQKGIGGGGARTVSFWVKADASQASGTRPTIVSWGAGNTSTAGTRFDINLNHTNGYCLRAEFNASGANFTTATRNDLRGAGWVHCAVVVPQNATVSQIQGYLDGVPATKALEPTGSGTVALQTGSTYDIAIGRISDATGSRGFRGMIDDVRIWPRALTAAEVASIAAEGRNEQLRRAWEFRYSGEVDLTEAGWSSDADGDGLDGWLEFALGGNPTVADRSVLPVFDGQEFRFSRRLEGLAAAAYRVEVSENLLEGSWEPVEFLEVFPHPERADFEEVKAVLPFTDAPARFMRLAVSP